jgi:hypothetical protein
LPPRARALLAAIKLDLSSLLLLRARKLASMLRVMFPKAPSLLFFFLTDSCRVTVITGIRRCHPKPSIALGPSIDLPLVRGEITCPALSPCTSRLSNGGWGRRFVKHRRARGFSDHGAAVGGTVDTRWFTLSLLIRSDPFKLNPTARIKRYRFACEFC